MRIFITGSTDGLGKLAALKLLDQGHQVVLHARSEKRKQDVLKDISNSEDIVIGDLSNMEETKQLANELNELGKFDAVIHNAGVYRASKSQVFTVNTLAPYILTSMMTRPERLIYVSSGLHQSGRANLSDLSTGVSYSDSKLLLVMLSMAVARKWPEVYSNAINPGWVPTKMGGSGAPDDLDKGAETQVWLAVSNDPDAMVSGKYFFHKKERGYHQLADDHKLQDQLLKKLEEISGIQFPE